MLHNPAIHRDLAYRFGVDPLVTARSNLSQALLPMGYPDKALEQTQLAIEYAKSLNHATTLGLAYLFAMIVHQQRQEKKEIIDLGQYANEHCHRYGLVLINFYCQTVYNWALGNIEPSRQMIAHHEKIHSLFGLTYDRSLVAENLADQGEHLEAIELFDKCISDAERLGERFHLSRLYQLKGQTLLLQGHTHHNDAGRCFTLAIETARTQKAPMLELFAVYSLAELWKKTNRSEEAEKLLTDICSQVPEQSTISILLDTKNLLKQFHK
jgi:tetratricopeptide (TPR) repeat protein